LTFICQKKKAKRRRWWRGKRGKGEGKRFYKPNVEKMKQSTSGLFTKKKKVWSSVDDEPGDEEGKRGGGKKIRAYRLGSIGSLQSANPIYESKRGKRGAF